MKKWYFLILILGIGILCNTCEKDDDGVLEETGIEQEILSEAEILFCDNQPHVELSAEEIVLSNGQTLDDYLLLNDPDFYHALFTKNAVTNQRAEPKITKDLLVARLNAVALMLTDRSNFVYPAGSAGQPAQNGLAYSYGSKIYNTRKAPSEGECTEEVYGLDCAGFIYQIFYQSGVRSGLWTTAEVQRRPDTLKKRIQAAFPELEKLEVEDLGKIDFSDVESGDIIYWLRSNGKAKHIGMILKDQTGNLFVGQSNGTGKASLNCTDNFGPSRGPRFMNLNASIGSDAFGSNYGIVRINIEDVNAPKYTKCSAMIKVYAYYHSFWEDGTRDYDSDNGATQTFDTYSGGFTEYTFNGSYSKTLANNIVYSGALSAQFNPTFDTIVSFNWNETSTSDICTGTRAFTATRVPLEEETSTVALFSIQGEPSCNHIPSPVVNSQTCSEGLNYSITSHKCTWASEIYILFSK